MWHTHEGMGWWMTFGGIMWILLLIVLVFAVLTIASARRRSSGPEHHSTEDESIEIARQRYARGEISREEYTQLLNDLQGHPG